MAHAEIDLDALSPEGQLELLDRLWDRVGRSPDLFAGETQGCGALVDESQQGAEPDQRGLARTAPRSQASASVGQTR